MRVLIRKLLPALPTVFISLLLAPDFDGIVYHLYLGFLLYYWVFILLAAIGFLISLVARRDIRAPSVVACLILLISSITLMRLFGPVEEILRDHSHLNRVHAVVTKTFKTDDHLKYIMTAQGTGGWDAFELSSGFTNIVINDDYHKGPSLHYQLKPDVCLIQNYASCYAPPTRLDPLEAFDRGRLPGIVTTRDFHEFMTVLETFASIRNKADFDRKFQNTSGETTIQIRLQPEENWVYRICFLLVCAGAIVTSLLLTSVPDQKPSSPAFPAPTSK